MWPPVQCLKSCRFTSRVSMTVSQHQNEKNVDLRDSKCGCWCETGSFFPGILAHNPESLHNGENKNTTWVWGQPDRKAKVTRMTTLQPRASRKAFQDMQHPKPWWWAATAADHISFQQQQSHLWKMTFAGVWRERYLKYLHDFVHCAAVTRLREWLVHMHSLSCLLGTRSCNQPIILQQLNANSSVCLFLFIHSWPNDHCM